MESGKKFVNSYSRRNFIKLSAVAGAGVLLSTNAFAKTLSDISGKMKYAQVGTGHRAHLYQNAIYKTYPDTCEMVGLCDTNEGRLKVAQAEAKEATGKVVPIYLADDFDKMLSETKPDIIIVTTVDGFHNKYIVRALELGYDVITEKPMTTEAQKCQSIIDAQRKSGKKITVTFNYRYSPVRTQVKDLLQSGIIGDILSVDFHWMLDTFHGADYFRRWHSHKQFSGGLMVHKATHHFDLVNWWLSAVPVTVQAMGKREFYTPETIKRFGLQSSHERCHTCPEKEKCAFELDLSKNPYFKIHYLDNEQYDHYYRDQCIFRPEINIEDTMNVLVKYSNNATMSYSLNAFNSWEGYYIIFNGTKGRLEHKMEEKLMTDTKGEVKNAFKGDGTFIRIFPIRGAAYEVDIWQGTGAHAGGDKVMLEDIFGRNQKMDPYLRKADQRAGAYSCLTGIAANLAFKENKEIRIAELVQNIGMPDFPVMPSRTDLVPMPVKITPNLD
jgi:predicted dehydrogenase